MAQWKTCEESINASIAAYHGPVKAELLPCFDLEHRGAYAARNEGLVRATGEWIAWVDCDDTVEQTWFTRIAEELGRNEGTGSFDVLVFGIVQEKNGLSKVIYSPQPHDQDGDEYGREMLAPGGMPHWLWHRVFRSELWEGVRFEGRVNEDYHAGLQYLPRVRRVRFIPDVLYRYIRRGTGLSSYVQDMDYGAACREYLKLVDQLPQSWQRDARMNVGLLLADVLIHAKGVKGANRYIRPYLGRILTDPRLSFRIRIKVLIAALMFWK